MTASSPPFDQVNLIVRDMDATLSFYRRLGLTIPDPPTWPPGSGARHAEVTMPGGLHLEFDNHEMAAIWHPTWRPGAAGTRVVSASRYRRAKRWTSATPSSPRPGTSVASRLTMPSGGHATPAPTWG